jgi:hypothetical protein
MMSAERFLAELFAFEYCAECGGDACHHTAVPFLGHWFARCDYAPADDGTPHQTVAAYRAQREG